MLIPISISHEHESLGQTLRDLFAKRYDVWTAVHDGRCSPDLWTEMAELGLPAINIPEEHGGLGYGPREMFLVHREMGRALLASPFFSTVALAANVLVGAGTEAAREEYLPRIAAGELTATVAVLDEDDTWQLDRVAARVVDGRISATKRFVLDGEKSDVLLVLARDDDGLGVYVVERDAPGVRVEALTAVDLTRPLANVVLEDAAVTRVSPAGDASASIGAAFRTATAALVAEQIGGAEHVLETAVEYARDREQFGVPIGSFQAIKHKLADVAFDVERMVSAGWRLVESTESEDPDAGTVLHLAKAFCSEAYFSVAAENIQVHGGIGFTWEHPAHLYFRRAKADALMLGAPELHREQLIDRLVA